MSEKYRLPHLPNAISAPDEHALYKDNFATGIESYRQSLLTSHSVIEMCFSCFMNTKYKCLRCELAICNKCSVFEENEDVEGWTAGKSVACNALYVMRVFSFYFSQLIAKERLDEHCISAFR